MRKPQVFISYAGHDAFEASLLQHAIESLLSAKGVKAWTYQRDQALSEKNVAAALKRRVKQSCATIFLVSPTTLNGGAAQWIELGYADAFEIETFVLLHHLQYKDLKSAERGVPPLLLASHCSPATDWKRVVPAIKRIVAKVKNS
jgi:hypothetical protein